MKSERELMLERRLEEVIIEREKAVRKMEDYQRALQLISIDYVLDGTSWAGRMARQALGRPVKREKERDEERAELAFIQAQYSEANESDLTRDALCLQLAVLKHELCMANERAAIAGRERDEGAK